VLLPGFVPSLLIVQREAQTRGIEVERERQISG
jgi:hypothetical protein